MSKTNNPQCLYCPDTQSIIDILRDDGRCTYSQRTPAELRQQQPTRAFEEIPLDEALRRIDQSFIDRPVEVVDESDYECAFEALPPLGACWSETEGSFKMGEPIANDIRLVYVRIEDRYCRFYDHANISHAKAVKRAREAMAVTAEEEQDEAPTA